MDYSWIWLDKNVYGYIELYYNGLLDADYTDHFSDPAISERIARGELFALGRFYASASLNLEVHPLVNTYVIPILNLNDGSGILMPRVVYDYADNIRLTVTGSFSWGAVIQNTEDMIFTGRPLIINPLAVSLPGPPGTSDIFFS